MKSAAGTSTGAILTIDAMTIWRRDRRTQPLVQDLSFSIGVGGVVALIGPSGVGKSSVLNAIAGFVPADGRGGSIWDWQDEGGGLRWSGRVIAGDRQLDRVAVERRTEIGMVMQGGLVYEHLSVLENVAFPLASRGGLSRAELRQRVIALLHDAELLAASATRDEIDDLLRQRASRLSGGQRQRLAIARALAKDPQVFLLDEAFANLDPILRAELFQQVVQMVRAKGRAALIVTHDLSDLDLVDEVILLGPGPEDHGATHRFYRRHAGGLIGDAGASFDDPAWTNWDRRIRKA